MPLSHTDTFQLTSDTARTAAWTTPSDQELKYFVNFTSSGQVVVIASGVTTENMTKLMGFGMNFPGTGTAVTMKTWSSGGYQSGLVQSTFTFNSGYQGISWVASGPSTVCPLTTQSGAVYAISCQNNYLASGQSSSGAVVLCFNN